MRRLVLLLFALLLVLELADDGCPVHARFVSPQASVKIAVTAAQQGGADQPDSPGLPEGAAWRGPPGQGRNQPAVPGVRQTLKLIDCCQTGSSGGLPR
jgi:hypothetical protein